MLWFAILCVAMGLAFLSFAAVQLNDPDPVQWIVIYTLVAAASFAAAARRLPYPPTFVLAAVLAGMLWFSSDLSRPFDLDDEVVREELGLALALGWTLLIAFVAQRVAARRTIDG